MSLADRIKNMFKSPSIKKIERLKPNEVMHSLKLGLALSGGGTLGIAYIGVFKAFNEAGIKFDYVAGTSVGALMAAIYSAGINLEHVAQRARMLKPKDILTNRIPLLPSRPDRLIEQTRQVLEGKNFADLKVPFTAVAVDIKSGEEVHFKNGDLPRVIAASCAVPGVFHPVEIDNYRLYDGGLRNNIPADVVREMGADIVVTVDANPNRGYGTESEHYIELMKAALRILMKANSLGGYIQSDYVIKLDLSKFSSVKADGADEMIQIGYETTKAQMPEILKTLGMRVPNEDVKETVKRLKMMKRRAKMIQKEKKHVEE